MWIIAFHNLLLMGITSATPVVEWDKTFGEAGNDEAALSVAETEDRGYIIAGKQLVFEGDSVTGEKALLIKTDANGNKIWIKTFGEIGGSGSGATSVQQTKEKEYILAGYTTSSENGVLDIWLIKTDENGNLMWSKTFGGKSEDRAVSVSLTKDGGYMITGYTTHERDDPEPDYSTGDLDILLIKTDENGTQQWIRQFGEKRNEMPASAMQTSDGGFIITGWAEADRGLNGWLIKTDDKGIENWKRTFSKDLPSFVQQTKDNGYIIAGNSMSGFGFLHNDISSSSEAWLIRTDLEGNTLWKKKFADHIPWSVWQTRDGGFIVAGNSYPGYFMGQERGEDYAWILRTDKRGNELWKMSPGGKNFIASSIRQTEDGGYMVAGTTDMYAMGRKTNAWLMKLREEPQTEPQSKKSEGFEVILAMAMLLGVYWFGRRK